MTILLPDDLEGFEEGLDANRLNLILGDLEEQGLTIRLPRYEVRLHQDLIPALRRMDISAAFNAADFSGITGDRSLAIGTVQHEAWVKVDEDGVEAAAATGIGFDTSGFAIEGEFRVDRPFLFLIRPVPDPRHDDGRAALPRARRRPPSSGVATGGRTVPVQCRVDAHSALSGPLAARSHRP